MAPSWFTRPDIKFGKASLDRLRPRGIAGVLVLRLRVLVVRRLRLAGTEFLLRCCAVRFFLKRFLEPLGRNFPDASLGKDLARRFPVATRLEDFFRLHFGGISWLKKGVQH